MSALTTVSSQLLNGEIALTKVFQCKMGGLFQLVFIDVIFRLLLEVLFVCGNVDIVVLPVVHRGVRR